VAAVAELINTSAGVGAFLVGLSLTGEITDRDRHVHTPLRDLFAGAFFLAIGLSPWRSYHRCCPPERAGRGLRPDPATVGPILARLTGGHRRCRVGLDVPTRRRVVRRRPAARPDP
jgi:hypothetical protein